MAISYLSVDNKGRATLPENVRASLGLRPGEFVLLERTERGTFALVPAALIPRDQLWFHHPEMQKRVRQAEAQIAAGRIERTRGATGAAKLLDGLKRKAKRRR